MWLLSLHDSSAFAKVIWYFKFQSVSTSRSAVRRLLSSAQRAAFRFGQRRGWLVAACGLDPPECLLTIRRVKWEVVRWYTEPSVSLLQIVMLFVKSYSALPCKEVGCQHDSKHFCLSWVWLNWPKCLICSSSLNWLFKVSFVSCSGTITTYSFLTSLFVQGVTWPDPWGFCYHL